MKILVLSDSHHSLRFMRKCVEAVKPDCILHLGDMYDDGGVLAEENPGCLFYQVPGNCDANHAPIAAREILTPRIDGINFYMTHGHRHYVKSYTDLLLRDARASGASVVLYGHTHQEKCFREPDGLWVMNPGTAGYGGGTAGLIYTENGKVLNCRILRQDDLGDSV